MTSKPIGLPKECHREIIESMEPQDFSSNGYDAVSLGIDARDNIVIVRHNSKTTPLPWEVAYGMSHLFFKSFADAMEFCQSSGMEILKGQKNV